MSIGRCKRLDFFLAKRGDSKRKVLSDKGKCLKLKKENTSITCTQLYKLPLHDGINSLILSNGDGLIPSLTIQF